MDESIRLLIEMKDNSVVKEMQAFLNSKTKRKKILSCTMLNFGKHDPDVRGGAG